MKHSKGCQQDDQHGDSDGLREEEEEEEEEDDGENLDESAFSDFRQEAVNEV